MLPLLLACSDQHDQPQEVIEFAFESYVSEPQPRGGACDDQVDVDAPPIVSGFGFNHANTRNQPSRINSGNVHELSLNYHYAPPNADEKRGVPAVTAQAIFATSGRDLSAINRKSGCTYWTFSTPDEGSRFRSSSILTIPATDTAPATVYAADYNGFVYALRMDNGQPLWQQRVGTVSFLHFVTGGLQYHAGKLFVPVSSKEVLATVAIPGACCSTHGMLVALDAQTGDSLWEYHTTSDPDEVIMPGQRVGPNGATVWGTPALDIERNAIYFGTGQNYTEPSTKTANAIISLNMDSGAVNWVFQARDDDAWNGNCISPSSLRCSDPPGFDFDFGAAPILLDDGDTIIAGDKGGVVYSLQADSGAVNWSRKISVGSALGGIHWGMAVDDKHVYVGATDFSIDKTTGGIADLIPGAQPGIYALDLTTGEVRWEIHPTHMFEGLATPSLFSASLSVSNDVLFGGSLDGVARAFHTEDGRELWSMDTAVSFIDINGNTGNGGTIESVGVVVAGDGVLINSGYSTFQGVDGRYQAGPGNALFVLQLPEN